MYRDWKFRVVILKEGGVLPAVVPELRHEHDIGVDGLAPTDGQVQPGNGDATEV